MLHAGRGGIGTAPGDGTPSGTGATKPARRHRRNNLDRRRPPRRKRRQTPDYQTPDRNDTPEIETNGSPQEGAHTMRVYYDRDADVNLIKSKKVVHRRIRQPGPCPCHEPERFRRQGRVIALREGSATAKKAEAAGFTVMTRADAAKVGRPDDDGRSRRVAGRHLAGQHCRNIKIRCCNCIRPRFEYSFQPDRAG